MLNLIPIDEVATDFAVTYRRGLLSLTRWSCAKLLRAVAAGAEFLADSLDDQKKKKPLLLSGA